MLWKFELNPSYRSKDMWKNVVWKGSKTSKTSRLVCLESFWLDLTWILENHRLDLTWLDLLTTWLDCWLSVLRCETLSSQECSHFISYHAGNTMLDTTSKCFRTSKVWRVVPVGKISQECSNMEACVTQSASHIASKRVRTSSICN